jgi:hypothetical protein
MTGLPPRRAGYVFSRDRLVGRANVYLSEVTCILKEELV